MEKIFSEVFAAAYAANIHNAANIHKSTHDEHMEAIQRASQAAYTAVAKFRELEVSTAPKSVLNPYR